MINASIKGKEDPQYPIGKFKPPAEIGQAERGAWINDLDALPAELRDAITGLDHVQLETVYREGGWTLRQVVHHLPDSHLNSYARFRLALTEENPPIHAYREADWAELSDAKTAPVELSLRLLESLHERWVILLRSMTDAQFGRTFQHSQLGQVRLDWALGLYAWHGRHHVAQIASLRRRLGW